MNGPLIPTKKVGDEDVIKEESEWDANDIKMAQLMPRQCTLSFVH